VIDLEMACRSAVASGRAFERAPAFVSREHRVTDGCRDTAGPLCFYHRLFQLSLRFRHALALFAPLSFSPGAVMREKLVEGRFQNGLVGQLAGCVRQE
jgi:hypothetical protein